MSDTDDTTPASYSEAGPGTYSTEEHLEAQQTQASASNGEPLHPELDPESELEDPADVGKKPPAPIDTAHTGPVTAGDVTDDDGTK